MHLLVVNAIVPLSGLYGIYCTDCIANCMRASYAEKH